MLAINQCDRKSWFFNFFKNTKKKSNVISLFSFTFAITARKHFKCVPSFFNSHFWIFFSFFFLKMNWTCLTYLLVQFFLVSTIYNYSFKLYWTESGNNIDIAVEVLSSQFVDVGGWWAVSVLKIGSLPQRSWLFCVIFFSLFLLDWSINRCQ